MRRTIVIILAATVALGAAPAAAQETNTADTTDTANTTAPAPETDSDLSAGLPADDNLVMMNDLPPLDDPTMDVDAVTSAPRERERGFPWGVLGLLGLVGLLGRGRSSRS
ncbi:MAG TPA: WGxxGxxG family protein [Sphingomicrobium sp.]|nr:WGxxGxxG family protein [Sphingomicrobium sp.]